MAVLDDQPARRCAQVLNIQTQGTLGLVLVAKQQGLIPVVRPVLEELKQAGMYMSDRLENQILAAAGSHRDAQARVLVSRCHPTRGRRRCPEPTSRSLAAKRVTSMAPDTFSLPRRDGRARRV